MPPSLTVGLRTRFALTSSLNCYRGGAYYKAAPTEICLVHELICADDAAYGHMEMEKVNGVRHDER
jgi:hypothetical protein